MNEAALPQSTVHIAQADPDGILLVIHAGAGNRGKKDTPERHARVEQDLNRALEAGYVFTCHWMKKATIQLIKS